MGPSMLPSRQAAGRVLNLFYASSLMSLIVGCHSAELWSTNGGQMLVTTADYRAINQTPLGKKSIPGRVFPDVITCAEPSPDVAKAVSTALNVSGSGGVVLPNGVTADVAAAVSRARAEALVQLGERLATIQLLRDGLHTACEAYANGAMTDTTYAVILSRFDKVMVTMLTSELAAGAVGRALATAGAESDGHAQASADLAAKITRVRELEGALENAKQDEASATNAVQDAASSADKKAAQQKADDARKQTQKVDRDLKNNIKSMTDSAAKVAQVNAGGGLKLSAGAELAKVLAEMQRKYIENLNFDAIEVACISALDRDEATATNAQASFRNYCQSTLMPEILKLKGDLWRAIVFRAEKLNTTADSHKQVFGEMENSFKEISAYLDDLKIVLDKAKAIKPPEGK